MCRDRRGAADRDGLVAAGVGAVAVGGDGFGLEPGRLFAGVGLFEADDLGVVLIGADATDLEADGFARPGAPAVTIAHHAFHGGVPR